MGVSPIKRQQRFGSPNQLLAKTISACRKPCLLPNRKVAFCDVHKTREQCAVVHTRAYSQGQAPDPIRRVTFITRAVHGGLHVPHARSQGVAQSRKSPPRCGDGYAALPLTAFKTTDRRKKFITKGRSLTDRPFVLPLGILLLLPRWCNCFPLRRLPFGKLAPAFVALEVCDHCRVQAPGQRIDCVSRWFVLFTFNHLR